jgi:hypothetical protein
MRCALAGKKIARHRGVAASPRAVEKVPVPFFLVNVTMERATAACHGKKVPVPNGINLSQLVTTPAFADIYHIRARRDLLSE